MTLSKYISKGAKLGQINEGGVRGILSTTSAALQGHFTASVNGCIASV